MDKWYKNSKWYFFKNTQILKKSPVFLGNNLIPGLVGKVQDIVQTMQIK